MQFEIKKDIKNIYLQVAAMLIGTAIIATIAAVWAPTRAILVANISFPLYGHLAAILLILIGAIVTSAHILRKRVKIYEARISRLELQATTDSLTGIPDSDSFHKKLTEEYSKAIESIRENRNALSIVILDIDDFKNVNDKYGYSAGDEVLISFAALIQSNVRGANDFVGKYKQGDEFGIILPDTSVIDAREGVAERLRGKVIEPHKFEIRGVDEVFSLSLTVSAGVTALQPDESLNNFIKRVEQALRNAKNSGKNTVRRLP